MKKQKIADTKKITHLVDDEGEEVNVKYIDKNILKRHFAVESIMERVMTAQQELKTLKSELFAEVKAYLDTVSESYGENWKGNARLYNFDKTKEVEIAVHRGIRFDERLSIAKTKIDDCLKRWSGTANEQLRMIVLRAFNVDKKGNVDVKQILQLKQFRFEDAVWQEAMKIIDDSITTYGTKEYLLFSMRDNPRADFKPITLNFSSLDY